MPLDRCFLLEKQFIINVTDAEESRNKFARLPHLAYYLIIIISNTPEKGVQGHIKLPVDIMNKSANFVFGRDYFLSLSNQTYQPFN